MNKLKSIFKTDDFMVFLSTMFLFGIGIGLFSGVMNNFLAEILSINRFERGVVEFLRELPGLSLILLLALLYRHSETKLIRVALLVAFCGVAGLFLTGPNRIYSVIFIMLWSTGEHLLMPVRQSIAIHSAHEGKEGRAMGITGSCGNIGTVTGYYFVPVLFFAMKKWVPQAAEPTSALPFRAAFLISAVFLLSGVLFSLRFHKSRFQIKKSRFYVRKKYLRYYILEVFFGARKQVFLTFAPFVLILNYDASTELIATLYGIYSLINIFLSPMMGKLIDKIGYKIILICDTILLIVICMLYGFSHHIFSHATAFIVISGVFMLDGMLFVVGMARSLYARSISSGQNELTSTLSTGISINHLISIIIALLGGLLWERLGIELLFSFAAIFGVGAFVFSCFLPTPVKQQPVKRD
ncbi:MFS transporter [candidate division KSB1 bacterium]|nr:MFS transporter [candidate division KSB1 bacterium]